MAVEPIRDLQKLTAIKNRLRHSSPRYYAFFTLGVNTALRPGDLLRLRAGDVYDEPEERLFPWTRGHAWRLVNRWCREVGLTEGSYGGHTLRKTWGYMARKYHGVPIELIQAKLGHSTPAVTRRYIGITDDEIEDVENHVNL